MHGYNYYVALQVCLSTFEGTIIKIALNNNTLSCFHDKFIFYSQELGLKSTRFTPVPSLSVLHLFIKLLNKGPF